MPWPPDEEEMRKDGIQKPKGIYCRKCGYYWEDWPRFFQHHKTKHQDTDPEVLKAAIDAGHEYIKWWRKLLGISEDEHWGEENPRKITRE